MEADQEPAAASLSLAEGRTVQELVLPVASGTEQDRAMPLVIWLAQTLDLPVRVIHSSGSADGLDADLESMVGDVRRRFPEIRIQSEQLLGDHPAEVIAQSLGPDSLAVLSTDHADAWSFKDSVAEALVHAADLPVVLVGPNVTAGAPSGDVVLGLDGSAPAESAVAPAVGLAEALGHRLWLVRVVPEPVTGEDRTAAAAEYLQEVAGRHPDVGPRCEVIRSNNPVSAIASFARSVDAGFLATGTRARSDMSRRSMSSISMGLVATAEQPVLTMELVAPVSGSTAAAGDGSREPGPER